MSKYFDALEEAMAMLAARPDTVFMGQAVAYPGTAMFRTLARVPDERRLELPVCEDMQLGMAIGMSLQGYLPICMYPRINFLLLAMSQLVLHLDKLPEYGNGWMPKVIVRTAVASARPMDPGPQHLGDFTDAIGGMLRNVAVARLHDAEAIHMIYGEALGDDRSWVIVEDLEEY